MIKSDIIVTLGKTADAIREAQYIMYRVNQVCNKAANDLEAASDEGGVNFDVENSYELIKLAEMGEIMDSRLASAAHDLKGAQHALAKEYTDTIKEKREATPEEMAQISKQLQTVADAAAHVSECPEGMYPLCDDCGCGVDEETGHINCMFQGECDVCPCYVKVQEEHEKKHLG